MAIPESQLSRWSHHGPQEASIRTHESIRKVLANHEWPWGMTYDFYLQGSYRNDTNIRGDSDVDVVLELNSIFNYDATALVEYDRNKLSASFETPTHTWNDFGREALKALEGGFGGAFVGQGNKSIKLKADPPRLAADVVVCMEHRKYTGYNSYVQGITFWALRDKRWVVNYPKEHYKNGAAKSSRTNDRYKRTVRMFKNARNVLEDSHRINSSLSPSYFLECLLFNAPDQAFQYGFQDTYRSIVNWICQTRLEQLVCQNCQQYLFGPSPEQWSIDSAQRLGAELVALWNNWD